jgi:hypothetical protein
MYAVVVSPIALLENKILWKDVQCNRKHAFEVSPLLPGRLSLQIHLSP